jgi:DNA-binding beta-propeller fold protein YncE
MSSLILIGCMSLGPGKGWQPVVLPGADTTLTLVQEIDAATLLYFRGPTASGRSGQTYSVGYAAAVAARGNDIYVVDRASAQLVHINPVLRQASVLTTLADPGTHGVHARRDGTVFVVDKSERAIRQLDESGRTVRVFSNLRLMPAPVDVAETDWGNIVVVADEISNQLIMFNAMAGTVDVIGSDRSRLSVAGAVYAIAATRDSVFVLDQQMAEVMRFSLSGYQTGNYGEDELEAPTALAVDDCGRLFMADRSGRGILVSSTDMISPVGRALEGSYVANQITDLWVDNGFLYVAAGIRGVAIYLIEPPCTAP